MDGEKRLEKILKQLQRFQKPLDQLRCQLILFKRESLKDAVTAKQLEEAIARFEWEMVFFRDETLYGYTTKNSSRVNLAKQFSTQTK